LFRPSSAATIIARPTSHLGGDACWPS
jgi:hypothetical protein